MNSERTIKFVVTVVFCFSVVDGLMSHAVDKTNWSAAPWPQHLSSQKYVRICKKCINKWHEEIYDSSSITAWCEIKLTIANVNVNISHSTNSSSLPIKEFFVTDFSNQFTQFPFRFNVIFIQSGLFKMIYVYTSFIARLRLRGIVKTKVSNLCFLTDFFPYQS